MCIGDTVDSVPLLLFLNTFASSASDTTSSRNLSRTPVSINSAYSQIIPTFPPVEYPQLSLSLLLQCYYLLV